MKLQVTGFSGEQPRIIPRLLADNAAQTASNVRLENGALVPFRQSKLTKSLPSNAKTIYLHNGEWYSFDEIVSVAPAPIAEDRLYYTGDGAPKMIIGNTVYDLAIQTPTNKPVASVDGEPDPDLSSTILYAYTWVTDFGEESKPSPVSDGVLWSPSLEITLTGFSSPPIGRAVSKMRIYRSQTSSLGSTELFFIAERDASTDPFIDDGLPIQTVIETTDFDPPPSNLQGIIPLPNGGMAGFFGKTLCFAEPYLPHTYPQKYYLTTDYPIVALGAFGSSIAVLTEGNPYIVQGTAPENMIMEKLELNLPCLSAGGVVDLGYSIAYPSHEGLVTISNGGANVVTAPLFTRTQWLKLKPETFVAAQFSGRYWVTYNNEESLLIDLSGAQPFLIREPEVAEALHYDIETGALYLLKDGTEIVEWDAIDEGYGTMTWKSKEIVLPTYTNFGAILVEGDDVNGGSFELRVYADKELVATVTKTNSIARLPAKNLARTWELEVYGNVPVDMITMAITPTELTM